MLVCARKWSAQDRNLKVCYKVKVCISASSKSQPKKKKGESPVVDVSNVAPPELRMFQFQLTKLVASILGKEAFITQVSLLNFG